MAGRNTVIKNNTRCFKSALRQSLDFSFLVHRKLACFSACILVSVDNMIFLSLVEKKIHSCRYFQVRIAYYKVGSVVLQPDQTTLLSGHLPVTKKTLRLSAKIDGMSFLNDDPMSTNVSNEKRHACCHMVKHFFQQPINIILLVQLAPVFLCLNF